MILYRAMYDMDLKNLEENGIIRSTLLTAYDNPKLNSNPKMVQQNYKICYIDKNIKDSLSLIYGHVNGRLVVEAKRSPWISLTSSFERALFHAKKNNRVIVAFEYDDNNIIKKPSDFDKLNIFAGALVDLSDNKLALYRRENKIVGMGEQIDKERTGEKFRISNLSTKDQEHLKFDKLELSNYYLIHPNEFDFYEKYSDEEINEIIKIKLEEQKPKQLVKK